MFFPSIFLTGLASAATTEPNIDGQQVVDITS